MITARNFTATFLKLDYLGLKVILDKNKIKYNKNYTSVSTSETLNFDALVFWNIL